jgi:hypothetical protein
MFRDKQIIQDKTQTADNGMSLPAKRAWRPTTSRLAEHGNITLKEY